jgi:hypothetical protein
MIGAKLFDWIVGDEVPEVDLNEEVEIVIDVLNEEVECVDEAVKIFSAAAKADAVAASCDTWDSRLDSWLAKCPSSEEKYELELKALVLELWVAAVVREGEVELVKNQRHRQWRRTTVLSCDG